MESSQYWDVYVSTAACLALRLALSLASGLEKSGVRLVSHSSTVEPSGLETSLLPFLSVRARNVVTRAVIRRL